MWCQWPGLLVLCSTGHLSDCADAGYSSPPAHAAQRASTRTGNGPPGPGPGSLTRLAVAHTSWQGPPGPGEALAGRKLSPGLCGWWNGRAPRKTPGAPTRGPRLARLGGQRSHTAPFSAPSCLLGASTTFFKEEHSKRVHTAKKCTERLRRGIKPELSLHSPTPTEKGSMRSLTTVAVVAMGFMLGHVGAAPMTNAQVPQSEAT
jgi:hypothetical protein